MNKIRSLFDTRTVCRCCCVVVLSFFALPTCRGDTFTLPAVPASELTGELTAQLKSQAQANADSMYDYMLLKLDELDRVCQLSADQHAKLRVAAKGAVEHTSAKWVDATVAATKKNLAEAAAAPQVNQNQVGAFGGGWNGAVVNQVQVENFFAGNGQGGVQVVRVIAPAQGLALNNGQLIVQQAAPTPVLAAQPFVRTAGEREVIWTSAVKKVLTPEQRKALQATTAERTAAADAPLVDQVFAEVDRRLLLDSAQREKVAESLRPLIAERLRTATTVQKKNPAALADLVLMRSQPAEGVATLLSKPQIVAWKTSNRQTPTATNPAANGAPANVHTIIFDGPMPIQDLIQEQF